MEIDKHNKEISLPSLSGKADAAFLQASRKVILKAKQSNTPIVVWEDDRIKEVSAMEMETRLDRRT